MGSVVLAPVLRTVLILGLMMMPLLTSCDSELDENLEVYANGKLRHSEKVLSNPTLIVSPEDLGRTIPPVGRSLFDYVFTEPRGKEVVYHIPFPFRALLERIEQHLHHEGQGSPLKGVLIPINRSLQRHASKPQYFASPRVVVGIDTEPRFRKGQAGMLFKDRLFLGYQEKSSIIEIISYNESAGRFEFQVVTNYGPNQVPVVKYANRALCTTCHQNHSPIFSRPLWDETNANPQIASLLEKQQRAFYGIPIHQGVDIPNAIDDSTNRANTFSAYQLLWQEGCEYPNSSADSIHCRADVLRLLLKYRLGGTYDSPAGLPKGQKSISTRLKNYWDEKWPQGLQIPSPDILNRNPLEFFVPTSPSNEDSWIQRAIYSSHELKSRVRSTFEPSLPRSPLTIWSASEGSFEMDKILPGLSGFLAMEDLTRLDDYLFYEGSQDMNHAVRYETECKAQVRGPLKAMDRILMSCESSELPGSGERARLFLEGVLYVQGQHLTEGTIEQLSLDEAHVLNDLEVVPDTLVFKNELLTGSFGLRQKNSQLHIRQANGNAIHSVTFSFPLPKEAHSLRKSPTVLKGSAIITVLDDFSKVDEAINGMMNESLQGHSGTFTRTPFQRTVLLKSFYKHLGMPALAWCCEDDRKMPPAISSLESHGHQSGITSEDSQSLLGIKIFQKYCAECHHEEDPFPPNFLHGSALKVQQQVAHCAERIFFRLHMWKVSPSIRPEAPMPPFSSLIRQHLTPDEWMNHSDLSAMENYVADVLQDKTGAPPELKDLLSKGYDKLQVCLPHT